MIRITPEEVQAAYKATGLKPVRNRYGNKTCGCPLVALTVERNALYRHVNWSGFGSDAYITMTLGIGKIYAEGFKDGVDGPMDGHHVGSEEYDAGYRDGKIVRKAIFNASKSMVQEDE